MNEPIKRLEIEALIVGHFDGTLNAEQEKQLAAELTTCAESKRRFLSYMRMEGRLHSLGRDGFLREPVSQPAASVTSPLAPLSEVVSAEPGGRQHLAQSQRQHRRWFAVSSLAVCAAVMLMLLVGIPWPSSVNASSVLQRAQAAAAELVDRTYHVVVSGAGEDSPETQLTIDMRGGGRFLMRSVDENFVFGSDGTEYWMSRDGGPVWVTHEARTLAPKVKRVMPNMWLFWMTASPKEPLLLDIHGVLSLIERRHNVELIVSDNPAEHHLRATLKNERRKALVHAPDRIDFWADAKSGVGLRTEVQWSDGRRVRFELMESAPFSEQWYHHSQHANDREVRHLPANRDVR